MKSRFNKYLLSFCLVLICSSVFAQKIPPTPAKDNDNPPPGLPVAGGLSYLLVVGVAYGVYELKRKKQLLFF